MSTATPAQTLTPVAAHLSAILGFVCSDVLLSGEAKGALHFTGRDDSGFADSTFAVEARQFQPPLVAQEIVNALTEGTACLHVGLCVRDGLASSARPIRLGAISATWTCAPTFVKGTATVPADWLQAAQDAVRAFPLPASLQLLGGTPQGEKCSYSVVYRLESPLPCATRAQRAAVIGLVRQLAEHLGADVPGEDVPVAALVLPVPGAPVRGLPPARVTCLAFDTAASVTPELLAEAVRGREE